MARQVDCMIIGAGVMGSCLAYELAKKGYSTLNLDKGPGAGHGSTGNSCAIIRVHYSTFDGAALAQEGVHYWQDWPHYVGVEDESGFAAYHNVGCAIIKTPRNDHLRRVCHNLTALGIPWEAWSAQEFVEHVPIVDPRKFWPVRRLDDPDFGKPQAEDIDGVVFTPNAGYISDPQLSAHNVQRAAEAHGATFRYRSEVTDIRRDRGRVVGVTLADGERIDAPVVVNVAGPHSGLVNGMAGVLGDMRIKTRALKVEVAHVPAPPGFDFEHAGCVVSDGDAGVYFRPEVGNHILVGSEDPECDDREWVEPDGYNSAFTEQWQVQVHRLAQRIPGLGIPNTARGVVDLYDVTDDWIPIYDKSDLAGYYMVIGTSGNQFKNAPVVGALMAELIDRCEHGHDHDARPLQFDLRYTGKRIDLGFYSRLREINAESSFSVIG